MKNFSANRPCWYYRLLIRMLLVVFGHVALGAEGLPKQTAQVRSYTFYLEGTATPHAAESVASALARLYDVIKVEELTATSGFANVTFDQARVTHQEIAEAVAQAGPYRASLRVEIPAYENHATAISAIFARVRDAATVAMTNSATKEFTVWFKPCRPGVKGFNLGDIGHPIVDPPPKGLGLTWRRVTAGRLSEAPKK